MTDCDNRLVKQRASKIYRDCDIATAAEAGKSRNDSRGLSGHGILNHAAQGVYSGTF